MGELTDEKLETIASGWDRLTLLTIAGIPSATTLGSTQVTKNI
jgi:hypothetical protein